MVANTVILLHTAEVHRANFSALRDEIAPDMILAQHVRKDWLTRAQTDGISPALRLEMQELIDASSDLVICTCTTLGPTAEALGAIRIDRPMMEIAAQDPKHILVVFTLESTQEPTFSLLTECIKTTGKGPKITPLFLSTLWPLFVDGEQIEFSQQIAKQTMDALSIDPSITTIVLAQASMAGAAVHINEPHRQVLTSPTTAMKYAAEHNGK